MSTGERVALLHYWLTNMRGGENVLAEFCRLYPEADLYTHAYNPARVAELFSRHRVTESWIGKLPGAKKNCQKYLPLMPLALQRWNFDGYDLLLSSESGPVKGIRKPAGTRHICYCHTPMRYLWDMYEEYYRNTGWVGKLAMRGFRDYLRRYDLHSAECVDYFVANSAFVADRIQRIYQRQATVIHPPVDVDYFAAQPEEKEDFYLFVGELIPYKQPQLAIAACRKMGRKLVIAGDGTLRAALEAEFGDGDMVRFAGRPRREELRSLYSRAKALLFPGLEDFGIVPVEAQAAGTPVIAYGAGGALETVLPERTGVFFPERNVASLCAGIETFEGQSWNPNWCRQHAQTFSAERFRAAMQAYLAAPHDPEA